jgi:methylmalonyl-CoA/ethylmalonyl-CoA epimerase
VIKKVEHIGIAVKDINSSTTLFERLLGVKPYKTEKVHSEGVNTAFFGIADQKIELLSSINKGSAIEKFLESKNEGVHHIALLVDSLEFEINRLEGLGFQFISKTPKEGADNKRIVFLHPKSTNGVLVELCEEI